MGESHAVTREQIEDVVPYVRAVAPRLPQQEIVHQAADLEKYFCANDTLVLHARRAVVLILPPFEA